MSEPNGCAAMRDELPGLAMGSTVGQERAQVLRHLMRCTACRAELDELSRVADDLLLLVPAQEPPPGFETAVLNRIGLGEPAEPVAVPAQRKRRMPVARVLQLAAAFVLVALLGAGAAWWSTNNDRRLAHQYKQTLAVADGRSLRAAPVLVSGPKQSGYPAVGYVFAYQGNPSWVLVTISGAPAPGRYAVSLLTVDGESMPVGTCVVSGSSCALGNTVNVPVSKIQAVRLAMPGAEPLVARLR